MKFSVNFNLEVDNAVMLKTIGLLSTFIASMGFVISNM